LPPEEVLATLSELRSDPTLEDLYKPYFNRAVDRAETALRDEKRYRAYPVTRFFSA